MGEHRAFVASVTSVACVRQQAFVGQRVRRLPLWLRLQCAFLRMSAPAVEACPLLLGADGQGLLVARSQAPMAWARLA